MGITAPGLFARNCSVRRLDKASAAAFLDANHRMGRCKCRYCYGLFVDRTTGSREAAVEAGSLVAVASFSAGRTMRDGTRSFEWIRFALSRGYDYDSVRPLVETLTRPDTQNRQCDE